MDVSSVKDENIIVLETGSYTTHAGCPIMSPAIASLAINAELVFPLQGPTAIVPSRNTETSQRIVVNGKVQDWSLLEKHWKHVLSKLCKIDDGKMTVNYGVLLVVPPTWSLGDIENAVQILFEGLRVPAVYIADQPVVSLYASGQLSGLVVDIGHDVTKITPVLDGLVLHSASECFTGLGGCALHEHLIKLLKKGGSKVFQVLKSHADHDDDVNVLEQQLEQEESQKEDQSDDKKTLMMEIDEIATHEIVKDDAKLAQIAALIIEGGHLLIAPAHVYSSASKKASKSSAASANAAANAANQEHQTIANEWQQIQLLKNSSNNMINENSKSTLSSTSSSSTSSSLKSNLLKIRVKKSVLFESSGVLFQESGSDQSDNMIGLFEALKVVLGRVAKEHKDKLSILTQNTLLTGYVSLVPGLREKLTREFSICVSEDCNDLQVKSLQFTQPIPNYLGPELAKRAAGCWSSWIGSAFVAKLVFNDPKNFITRSDYNTMGPRISHRKPI